MKYYNLEDEIPANIASEPLISFQPPSYVGVGLMQRAKQGIAAKKGIDFMALSNFTPTEFQTAFDISLKTVQNYNKAHQPLSPSLSEKLLLSFNLYEKGTEVFGTADAFSAWLHKPAYGLDNAMPINLMDTITGINLITEEITRIAYGDLA